ncbi:MAG: lipopolysaccharide export system protein LptA [Arenicella sp.]|jgi:lipopolysaccharide export system protein LptA
MQSATYTGRKMKTYLTIGRSLFIGLIVVLSYSTQAIALSSDRDQPAQIEADDTEINFKTGVRTLTNNVLVVQGTLRVKADKLVVTYDKQGELVKAVADGSLARFKQRPDDKPEDVEGWAKKIMVDYPNNTITLTGKAALKQGATTATGNQIVYNMATDKLNIIGNSAIDTVGKDGAKPPKRKIKDPFEDDDQGPAQTVTAKPSTDEAKGKTNTEQAAEPTAVPAKAGRSRLILAPKKKP